MEEKHWKKLNELTLFMMKMDALMKPLNVGNKVIYDK